MLGLRGTSFSQSSHTPRPFTPMSAHTNGHRNGDISSIMRDESFTNGHNGTSNGHGSITNGHDHSSYEHDSTVEESHSHTKETHEETRTSRTEHHTSHSTRSFTSEQQITVLRQTVKTARINLIAKIVKFDEHVDSMTLESLLEYIEDERLTNMPQRGSRWDKVLKWAEFFALQISGYEKVLAPFVLGSGDAARLIWASCRSLIELGPTNAQAIETAFAVLYKVGLSLSFFLRHSELLSSSSRTRMQVGEALNDLLLLVQDITLHYHFQIKTQTANEVTVDFNTLFGRSIESFYTRKGKIIDGMWNSKIEDDSIDIQAIRKWLSVQDAPSRLYQRDRAAAKALRDEYTCDWIQRHLLDFSRSENDVLVITGKSGTGKSMLSGWILERLQRPIGKKTYETLSISIDIELREQCNTFSIAKSLALQLLSSNIGDVALLKALNDVFGKSLAWTDRQALESGLWKAIHTGLANSGPKPLAIVVDGLDDRCGHQTALNLSNRLSELTAKYKHVQAIVFARNSSHFTKKVQSLAITPDHTHFDLQHITEHALERCQLYLNENEFDREKIVEKLTHAAKGNFLWVQLMARLLKQEHSKDGFMKAIKNASEAPKSVSDLIKLLISSTTVDYTRAESLLLLSWLLVADRPLTTGEIAGLLKVDIQKKTLLARHTNVEEEILALGGSLIRIQNGIVRFRHGSVREQLLQISVEGKKLRNISVLQSEFTTRLVAYCKFSFSSPFVCSFDQPKVNDSLFLHDGLIEYASRRWISHFKQSTYYQSNGQIEIHADFKALFPSTVQLVMIEWGCWKSQSSLHDAVQLHDLALRIRQAIFTEKHQSVIQTLISCGHVQRELSRKEEAASCFYRASKLSQIVLQREKTISNVTITCTTLFLEITETLKFTTRTEIATRREEFLRFIIGVYTTQHGRTSDLVIKYYKTLAELYVFIHEEDKAEICWKEIREIIIQRYGKGSSEEVEVCGHLNIVLKKGKTNVEIEEYENYIFETTSELERWDIRTIQMRLDLAISYEAKGLLFKAEECFVLLWSGLIEYCGQIDRHLHIEIEISMLDISLAYAHFLHRHGRHEEASSIMICIWAEYEEYEFESEILFLRLKIIGELMRTIGLLDIAVRVFRKCWAWFKFHDHHEHTVECDILVTETISEISTKTTETTTTTTTTTTTIKEIFESSITKTTVTKETISVFQSLISLYMKSEQWEEAILASKRSLTLIWKLIVTGRGTVGIPREFGSEAIEIAIQLALCYHKSHYFHEAEEVYLRIYHACVNSCGFTDERFINSYTLLLTFYEEHSHWEKVIHIKQELLARCRKHLGVKHALTIKFLYELGSLCTLHGHSGGYEHYEEIIVILNGSSKVYHKDSFRAMEILCRYYYEQGHWKKLKFNCEVLWECWTNKRCSFSASSIEILYKRYIYVLEHHFHAEFEIIRRLTLEFRDTCVLVFGVGNLVTLRALIALGHICMRSEKYTHEAITYYEEVIKITETTTTTTKTETISTTTLTTVKERLSNAYIHVCSKGTVTVDCHERAILVLAERFKHLTLTLGCAHSETLTILVKLVEIHLKFRTKESISIVIKLLLDSTITIISKELRSRALFEAAKRIGGIYRSCGFIEEGRKFLRELHLQIIFKSRNQGCGFAVDKSAGRSSLVFLATFEEILLGSISVNYSKIIAGLLVESILFESYQKCIKSGKNVEETLKVAGRLYVVLEKSSRKEQIIILQEEVLNIFTKKWGSILKTKHEISVIFVTSLLRNLGEATGNINIGDAACRSSNSIISQLLLSGEIHKAYEVAHCAFKFAENQGAYNHRFNVGYGFKLSSLMASRGISKDGEKNEDSELHKKMLELSRKIITVVLEACRASNVNFARIKLPELNDLILLLGDQKNYTDLDWVLTSLWSSREVQKQWSPPTIVSLAKLVIQTRFLLGQHSSAIKLGEAICYNLRRVYGALDPKALEVSDLLSQVYIAAGHYNEAMRLHEEILRLIAEGDDFDDRTIDTVSPKRAFSEINMLKQCFLLLKGWDKKQEVYKDLVDQILAMPAFKKDPTFKTIKKFDSWSLKETPEANKDFKAVIEWRLAESENGIDCYFPINNRPKNTLRRITSNWGMDIGLLNGVDHHHGHGGHKSPGFKFPGEDSGISIRELKPEIIY